MPVRVLLLDDDLAFATEARAAFAAAGCDVEVLADGVAAVASAEERLPDVVLASAELPGVNGFRLCSRLKKSFPDLSVVLTFVDASATGVSSHQRLATRADAYVPRSVALHELVARVRALARKRPRSDTPTSSRRRSATHARPRSKTPGSTRAAGGRSAALPPMAAPRPLTPLRSGPVDGPPRPDPASSADRNSLRRVAEAAKAERDDLKKALGAARTDADALRRALDQARQETETKVRDEVAAVAADLAAARAERVAAEGGLAEAEKALAAAEAELLATRSDRDAALTEVERLRGELDGRAKELTEARGRIARLEAQLVDAERESHGPTSERVDQRLLVLQRTADGARAERDEARAAFESEVLRSTRLEKQLAEEAAAREAAELLRLEAEAQSLLATEADPASVEAQIAQAVERARREHALEMTRLRGEHAAVVFQHRHELAALRAKARAAKPTPTGVPRAQLDSLVDIDAFAEPVVTEVESIEAMRARHERELDAMRANLDVAIRRVETLERQLGDDGGSGERPSLATTRGPGRTRGAG